jgi:hypothetical protein
LLQFPYDSVFRLPFSITLTFYSRERKPLEGIESKAAKDAKDLHVAVMIPLKAAVLELLPITKNW